MRGDALPTTFYLYWVRPVRDALVLVQAWFRAVQISRELGMQDRLSHRFYWRGTVA